MSESILKKHTESLTNKVLALQAAHGFCTTGCCGAGSLAIPIPLALLPLTAADQSSAIVCVVTLHYLAVRHGGLLLVLQLKWLALCLLCVLQLTCCHSVCYRHVALPHVVCQPCQLLRDWGAACAAPLAAFAFAASALAFAASALVFAASALVFAASAFAFAA